MKKVMKKEFYAYYDSLDNIDPKQINELKARNIQPGCAYKVVDFHMGQSTSSIVILDGAGDEFPLNSVGFSFCEMFGDDVKKYDPFSDPDINMYLPQR